MKQHPKLLKSFGYATRGLVGAIKSERNIRIHMGFARALLRSVG